MTFLFSFGAMVCLENIFFRVADETMDGRAEMDKDLSLTMTFEPNRAGFAVVL
jgi:hypothetical protein